MEPKSPLNLALVALALAWNGTSANADIIVSSITRSVSADAVVALPDSITSTAPGSFSQIASSSGSGGGVTVQIGRATQTSSVNLSAPSMSGQGNSVASYFGANGTSINPTFDSLFDVFFTVDTSAPYTLTAGVTWTGTSPRISGFASVELKNLTDDTTLALFQRDPGQLPLPPSPATVSLQSGVNYRLIAESKVTGSPNQSTTLRGNAQWLFDLTPVAVPEPGSMVLMLSAFATMSGRTLRRRPISTASRR